MVDDDLGVTRRISVIHFPQDEELVRSLSPTQRADMAMTGIVKSANLYQNLEHDFWLARWRAIQVLRETSHQNDIRSVQLLLQRIRDVMLEVVVAALEAVAEICSRGSSVCKLVTESVLPLLEHEGSMVRHAAVLCLKKTADLRDKSICKAILQRFRDPDSPTHLAAMSAMLILGDKRDYEIIEESVAALEAEEDSKREAAVALLKQFSTRGDVLVVKGLEKMCMDDSRESLRALAASSLSHWASGPEDSGTSSLLVRLTTQSKDSNVRRTALMGMLARLKSRDQNVRRTALRSLTDPEEGLGRAQMLKLCTKQM